VLRGVAVRNLPRASGPASADADAVCARLLAEALGELEVHERRCVCALGEPFAILRSVRFPPMSRWERERAARFEAARHIGYPLAEAAVRIVAIDASDARWALGVVRERELRRRCQLLECAGLRVVGVDHEAYALRRAFPSADAILDVGHAMSRFYAYGGDLPYGIALEAGSAGFTAAIGRALDIDLAGAERRKRLVGMAGAGESSLEAFVNDVARAIRTARSRGAADVQRIALSGNGARLAGLAERLRRDTGCDVELASQIAPVSGSAYPADVVRAHAPDWSLAIGLALWGRAGSLAA
jgi:Tfp pilus assembly PilM family ATPase